MRTAIQGYAAHCKGRAGLMSLFLGIGLWYSGQTQALTFDIPENSNIVGSVKSATVRQGDTLSTIGRRFDIGGYEMKEANPGVSYLFPEPGSRVTIPSRFVLPDGPRKDIVINLAEMRLYYYHPNGRQVSTYPIGIGQQGWRTPTGKTSIVRMRTNPWWIVPESILEKHRRLGKPIPPKKAPGPDNPLGNHAMNLGFKNIVIHGTPYPNGVGIRSSHGCIRMLGEDIAELYQKVKVGTEVRVVHQPQKIGITGEHIYIEAHEPLSEPIYHNPKTIEQLVQSATSQLGFGNYKVSWGVAKDLSRKANGYPERIGKFH